MKDTLYEIIKYLGKIKNLNEGDLIMIRDEFYEYRGRRIVEGDLILALFCIELDENDELTFIEKDYYLDVFKQEVSFEGEDFNIKKGKKLLEKIIEKYNK